MHEHTRSFCTHNCGSVPAGGQSLPSSYTFIHSFPSFSPLSVVPALPPLDLSLSFIPRSFSGDRAPLLLLKPGKKESVKDTEELANSYEKLGGRGQNHRRGQLWLGLCRYACVCVDMWFVLGLIVTEASRRQSWKPRSVLHNCLSPPSLLYPSFPLSVWSFFSITSLHTVTSALAHLAGHNLRCRPCSVCASVQFHIESTAGL